MRPLHALRTARLRLLAFLHSLAPPPATHTWHGPRMRPDGTALWVWHGPGTRYTITRRDDGPYCAQAHPPSGAEAHIGTFGSLLEAQTATQRPHLDPET